MNTDRTAARTAADALADIAAWAKRTFIVALVGVGLLIGMGRCALREYLAAKSALTTAAAQVEKARAELGSRWKMAR